MYGGPLEVLRIPFWPFSFLFFLLFIMELSAFFTCFMFVKSEFQVPFPFPFSKSFFLLFYVLFSSSCKYLSCFGLRGLGPKGGALSRFVTPDWVTDHVTGQVTFHRPFQCLFVFVCVCLLMFGHLTFSGNCI